MLRVKRCECDSAGGWKLTQDECPTGYMRWETTCCISPTFYDSNNKTVVGQEAEAATEALVSGDQSAIAKIPVQDFRAANEERTGPLIDTIEIQEGASYVPRVFAEPERAADAFHAVVQRPNDPNAQSFCKRLLDDFEPHNLATALTECDTGKDFGKHYDNKFLRVSYEFGTGFSGEWGFRAETHAFHGSLVLEQRGVGPLVHRELEVMNSHKGTTAATITIHLSPGTYTLTLYAAYDRSSHNRASKVKSGSFDALMFRQATTCKVDYWKTITKKSMETCGGNEVRSKSTPEVGSTSNLMTVKQIEPRVDFGATDQDEGKFSNDTFDATKIDGSSLKAASQRPKDSELTVKNMADFDGAFFSMKVSKAAAVKAATDDAKKLAVEYAKGDGKDTASDATGFDIPDIPDIPETVSSSLGGSYAESKAQIKKRQFDFGDGNFTSDNYFILQARIVYLCFSMEIDVRIVPGPPEQGGGIHARFTFLWSMGDVELTFIEAQLDLVPFDFSPSRLVLLATDPAAFMADIYMYLGIEIRPTIINVMQGGYFHKHKHERTSSNNNVNIRIFNTKIHGSFYHEYPTHRMEFIEPALRIVLKMIMMPMAAAVFVAQKVLDLAIAAVEYAKKGVRAAQAALAAAERSAMRVLNEIASKYLYYQRMEETANVAGKFSKSKCEKSFTRNSNTGCIVYNGVEKCTWQPSKEYEIPAQCGELVQHWKDKQGAWSDACCGFWTRIKRIFLKILYVIAKIIVYMILLIPKILLKIVEAILIVVEIALKVAEMALKIALCLVLAPLNNHREVLDSRHHLSLVKLNKWIDTVKILRVNELLVATLFDQGKLSINMRSDLVFFNKHLDIGIKFVLNFADLVAGFAETVKDLMKSFLDLFGETGECVASVVTGGSRASASLGWSDTPQPQKMTMDEASSTSPRDDARKLVMHPGGEVLPEIHVDHAVARFAKRHSTKLGPRARLPWVQQGQSSTPGLGQSESLREGEVEGKEHPVPLHAILGARPILSEPVEAIDFEGFTSSVEDSELGAALQREHEAHVTAVAAAAVAQKAGGVGAAAKVAAHALGVKLDATGRLVIGDEWSAACLEDNAFYQPNKDVAHCGATAYAAAVACTGATTSDKDSRRDGAAEISAPSSRACAAALSSLSSYSCASSVISKRCVARTADFVSFSCSSACGAAVSSVSGACGGFVLRAEHGDHAAVSSEVCSDAVRSAQSSCSTSSADKACLSLLEAVPAADQDALADADDKTTTGGEQRVRLGSNANRHGSHRRHVHHRRATIWRSQHARGVIPEKHLCGGAGHVDLRDNVLVGSVPACAWSLDSGRDALLLSRNLLSGTVGKLGAQVRRVHASENRLTGNLTVAFSGGARDLEVFDVAHNRLDGDLGAALHGESSTPGNSALVAKSLRVLHLEGNALTDTAARPVVHAVLSKVSSLRSYDISGNKFNVVSSSSQLPRATGRTEVHVALHIEADTRHLCAGVPVEGFALNCGEMLSEPVKSNLHTLECAVHATAEAALLRDDDAVSMTMTVPARVHLRRERVMPFKSQGSIVSYTIRVERATDSETAVSKIREALISLGKDKGALRRAAESGGCDEHRVPFLSQLPIAAVHARLGCAPGLHGPGCRYACMGRWERNDVTTPAPHDYYAEEVAWSPPEYLVQASETGAAVGDPATLGAAHRRDATEVRRRVVQHWEGEDEEKHVRSGSLRHCTIACRGHANRALHTCHEWIDDRTDGMKRRRCAVSLKDMGDYCQVTLSGAGSQCESYVKLADQDDDHDCQVCGIHRYFEQHGAYGGGQSHYTTHDFSVYSNGESSYNAIHLNDARRKAKTIAEEEKARNAALGTAPPERPPEPSQAHVVSAAEDYIRGQFSQFLPRRTISRAINDGFSNAEEGPDDASELESIHENIFAGMSIDTAINSQFPTCRGDERCSEDCVLSVRSATEACMDWLHAGDSTYTSSSNSGGRKTTVLSTDACAASLNAARGKCTSADGAVNERARCLEPLAAGFHALGVPAPSDLGNHGASDAISNTDDVDRMSSNLDSVRRSLLNADQRSAGEPVMPYFGTGAWDETASYPVEDDREFPPPEEPVVLTGKGKRNFDLVSSVCRPSGVTEQEIAAVCLKKAKWVKTKSRLEVGWGASKHTRDELKDVTVTHELMDESDSPVFKCNIPYLGSSYEESSAVEFEVVNDSGYVVCGGAMDDGEKVVYDFYVEARLRKSSSKMLNVFVFNNDDDAESNAKITLSVKDVKVRFHAYGKMKRDMEQLYNQSGEETVDFAQTLSQGDFKSGGYKAVATFIMNKSGKEDDANVEVVKRYLAPDRPGSVKLDEVIVEFEGQSHGTAPRLSKATAKLEVDLSFSKSDAGFVNVAGEGFLPFPLTCDRPLVASTVMNGRLVTEEDVDLFSQFSDHGKINSTVVIYPDVVVGDVCAKLHGFFAVTEFDEEDFTQRLAVAVDIRKTSDDETKISGYATWWDVSGDEGPKSSYNIDFADVKAKKSVVKGDAFSYSPNGAKESVNVSLASKKRKVEGCRDVAGSINMKLGSIKRGRGEGGYGKLPNPLVAPAWGTADCKNAKSDPDLVISAVLPKYAPWPDDIQFVLRDVVIKFTVTVGSEEDASLNTGNLVGSLRSALDLSSSSSHGLPPFGGWAVASLNFWATKGDLRGTFRSSKLSVSGVIDSRLGDSERPYARIIAPVVAELPCEGRKVETVGSIFANISGIFRLHADDVPITISCGNDEEEDDDDANKAVPGLTAAADLELIIEPSVEFNKIAKRYIGKANKAIDEINKKQALIKDTIDDVTKTSTSFLTKGANLNKKKGTDALAEKNAAISKALGPMKSIKYDGTRFTIPWLKTLSVTARHVRSPAGWYWDGDLVATTFGGSKPLQLTLNGTFNSKDGFPPLARLGAQFKFTHESFDIFAALAPVKVGPCYDAEPYRLFGEIKIHPPKSLVSNATLNVSVTQYCQKEDGTTEYFFRAQIDSWEIVPGKFGIPDGLIVGTLIKTGDAIAFKYWEVHIEGTIGILGGSSGDIPEMGSAFLLYINTKFNSKNEDFRIELRADFAIESRSENSLFRVAGSAEFAYPCVFGDRVGALINLTADIGDMLVEGLAGSAYFYCDVSGTDAPAVEVEIQAEGVVQFVKGVNVEDFHIVINGYKSIVGGGGDAATNATTSNASGVVPKSSGKETEKWIFAGSVEGTLVFGTTSKHGASVDFVFDSRDGSWSAGLGYEINSANINMTLKMGTASYCKPEGTYIKGAISVKIGEEGFLYGSARGAKNCGDYRLTKGVINVRVAIDDAKIKTSGMLMYLEDVRLQVRGDTPDHIAVEEGFMESQENLPVDNENPYFTPMPGYGRRRLLNSDHEPPSPTDQYALVDNTNMTSPNITFPSPPPPEGVHARTVLYRTNCFDEPAFNSKFPNLVFKSMNNEEDEHDADDDAIRVSWKDTDGFTPSQSCVDINATRTKRGLNATKCNRLPMQENNVSHPFCRDQQLLAAFLFETNCSTKDSDKLGTEHMSISYNCLNQPSDAEVPIGQCRTVYHEMRPIQLGGGKVSDLKVLEQYAITCDEGEALGSFMTTTNPKMEKQMGWKYTCCKLPDHSVQVPGSHQGDCFLSAPSKKSDTWLQENIRKKTAKFPIWNLFFNPGNIGAACGPGEAITSWTVEACSGMETDSEEKQVEVMDSESRFVWKCVNVGTGIQPPPPPKINSPPALPFTPAQPAPPPPHPPVDDDIDNLDWIGNFTATAKVSFGEDVDNAALEKALGIIKVAADFSITDGDFSLDKLDFKASVEYVVPAKPGSWQEDESLDMLQIKGFVTINYPVRGFCISQSQRTLDFGPKALFITFTFDFDTIDTK